MKKPANLRKHLETWVPDLKQNPDKLHLFIERGRIACRYGKSLSWLYKYTLQLIITDFAESPDVLVVPLLIWISEHQPNLLLSPETIDQVVNFEAEVLNHEKVDIALTLELSERVIVTPADPGYRCDHVDEPPLPNLSGPRHWAIYLKGELIGDGVMP